LRSLTGAFFNCRELSTVILEEGIREVGDYAFSACDSIEEIIIPNSITSIGVSAFEDCDALKSVIIGEGVTSINAKAFYSCGKLQNMQLGKNLRTIKYQAFDNCNLKMVIIPRSVTTIERYAFANNYNLKIYCEVDSQPSGWVGTWFSGPVYWGYTGA